MIVLAYLLPGCREVFNDVAVLRMAESWCMINGMHTAITESR